MPVACPLRRTAPSLRPLVLPSGRSRGRVLLQPLAGPRPPGRWTGARQQPRLSFHCQLQKSTLSDLPLPESRTRPRPPRCPRRRPRLRPRSRPAPRLPCAPRRQLRWRTPKQSGPHRRYRALPLRRPRWQTPGAAAACPLRRKAPSLRPLVLPSGRSRGRVLLQPLAGPRPPGRWTGARPQPRLLFHCQLQKSTLSDLPLPESRTRPRPPRCPRRRPRLRPRSRPSATCLVPAEHAVAQSRHARRTATAKTTQLC